MMKHCQWLLAISFLFPVFLTAQCAFFDYISFLSFNQDVHYKGLADIGVIGSGYSDEIVAWKKNPSLLSQKEKIFLVETNTNKNGDLYGNTLNINSQIQFSPKWAVGIDASYVPYQFIQEFDNYTRLTYSSNQYEVGTSFAYSIGKGFSVGGGLSYFSTNTLRSQVISGGYTRRDDMIFKGFTFQFGGNYKREISLNEEEKLIFEAGFSFNTLGNRVSYNQEDLDRIFLPGELLLGGRIGWQGSYAEGKLIGVSLLAQLDHSLQPDCDFSDKDQNGIPDYFEKSSLAATLGSFNDHPDGLSGEIQSMFRRIALEPWIDLSSRWKTGFGIGYGKVESNFLTQEFLTFGLNASYKHYKFNVHRQEYFHQNEILSSPWGISITYSRVLTKKNNQPLHPNIFSLL